MLWRLACGISVEENIPFIEFSEMKLCDLWRLRNVVSLLLFSYCCGAEAECPQAIFAFGASMTDTGNSQAVFPFQSAAQSAPYGETFFRRPANRWSDGRVVVDFFGIVFDILQGWMFTLVEVLILTRFDSALICEPVHECSPGSEDPTAQPQLEICWQWLHSWCKLCIQRSDDPKQFLSYNGYSTILLLGSD